MALPVLSRKAVVASRIAATATALSLLVAPLAARADPTGASVHVVAEGETLSQIADAAGTDSATLARLNNLANADLLVVGQSLNLPALVMSAPASASASPVVPDGPSRTITVAHGDTLWSLAQQYSTTVAALVQANTLDDADHLTLGARLVLPAAAAATPGTAPAPAAAQAVVPVGSAKRTLLVPYTVQPGETLTHIARQFEVRADSIAQASALEDPNRLSIGTVLKIPLPGHEHEVKAGETLRDIARQEKVDLGSLIDFNLLADPELIRVGQVVMVPTARTSPAPVLRPTEAGVAAAPAEKPAAPAVGEQAAATTPPLAAAARPTGNGAGTPRAVATKPAAPVAVVAAPKSLPTDELARASLKLLGTPYLWGGSSPAGFDCSGLVWYAARQAGKSISRGLLGEYNSGSHPGREELKPGDLVFFQNTYSAGLSHNGIYIGNNQFVNAADEAAGVTISSLASAYWTEHWFGATRLS